MDSWNKSLCSNHKLFYSVHEVNSIQPEAVEGADFAKYFKYIYNA